MPRIDPERLLKTLAPLLEPESGAIRSNSEVDKIYGLMSKFSKKLVSKCTYINILKATQPEVLDLFLQRGGWDMVLGWTSDAASKNNYDLLKEITGLLLYAPATIQRLKENELPKVVKSISRDCENEEIRDLAKQVVIKWIAVAKNQEFSPPAHHIVGSNFPTTSRIAGAHPVPVQSCSITSTKPTVIVGDTDAHTTTGDLLDISSFDISQAELNAMIEFNPDDFSKACEQHLGLSEAVASGNTIVHSIDNANVLVDSSDTIKINLSNAPDDNRTPKLSINTIGGQHVEVHVDPSGVSVPPTKQAEAPLHCIMVKDGKPFLVRLKLAPPKEIAELRNSQEITSTSSGDLTPEKKIAEKKKGMKSSESGEDKLDSAQGMRKTYSKRNPVEVIAAIAQPPTEISSKSKSSRSSDSPDKKPRSSSKGSSLAAAAAAKKAAEEEKLKEKIKQEKANLKKRAKEAARAKQKQQDKDQETLKQLNLNMEPSVTTPPKDKFHKIPKRQPTSFSDAIGIPGSVSNSDNKSVKKKSSSDATHKNDSSKVSNKPESSSNNDAKDKNKEKESRRHRPKVFTKKSRGEDLLKDMTETVKPSTSSKSNKSESSKSNESSGLMGEKLMSGSGNSLILKPEKRPSIDNMEKPGDSKKAKIDSSDKTKDNTKQPPAKKASFTDFNMFTDFDASQTSKPASKKKRRLSSVSNDNGTSDKPTGKIISNISPLPSISSITKDKQATSGLTNSNSPAAELTKPIFNFYRETLDDKEPAVAKEPLEKAVSPNSSTDAEPMDISRDENELIIDSQVVAEDGSGDDSDSVIPIEEDLSPLKSVLVIHRPKNKPRKTVRWREEEELTEIYTFECDEDERVNVTKHKDFMTMKEHERAEEKEFVVNSLRHGMLSDDGEEKMPWRVPLALYLTVVDPIIESKQKEIQEERERLNLGVFLPPGSLLPESGSEPDPASPTEEERRETKIIPMEDVMNVTKVYDNRNLVWPKPKVDPPYMHRVTKPVISPNSLPHHHNPQQPFGMSSNFGDIGMQQHLPVHNSQLRGFPTSGQNQMDFNNPWSTMSVNSHNSNIPVGVPNHLNGFPTIIPTMNMNLPPPGPIGFPPPSMQNNNPFGFPLQQSVVPGMPMNFTSVPPPALGQMLQDNNIAGIGAAANAFNNRGITSNSTRDYSDRDLRRTLNRDSNRDQDLRQRDGYDSRGRSRNDHRSSRDHDRDRGRDHSRRSPTPPRRRRDDRGDRDRQDKDYRDHDYRSRPRSGGKRDVPCRYFAKGHCHSGSRCEFSHEAGQGESSRSAPKSESSSSSSSTSRSSKRSPTENWEEEDNNLQYERRPSSDVPVIDIADTPSSPTNDIAQDSSLLPAKIIPVE